MHAKLFMQKELLKTTFTEEDLLGLPLKEAVSLLRGANLDYKVIEYSSLRGVEGANDERVLRAEISHGCAMLVVSAFKTEI